jgi:hypothetical protein
MSWETPTHIHKSDSIYIKINNTFEKFARCLALSSTTGRGEAKQECTLEFFPVPCPYADCHLKIANC